jgi:hypothetical protein
MVRWGRSLRGKALAIVCGFFPFFLFFNLLGFRERIDVSRPENGGAISNWTNSVDGKLESSFWFWGVEGHLVCTNDFLTNKVFALASEADSQKVWHTILAKWSTTDQGTGDQGSSRPQNPMGIFQLLSGKGDEAINVNNATNFASLEAALAPYRIDSHLESFITNQQIIDARRRQPPADLLAKFSQRRFLETRDSSRWPQFILLISNSCRPTRDNTNTRPGSRPNTSFRAG